MGIEAITAVANAAVLPSGTLQSVTLAEMISTRLQLSGANAAGLASLPGLAGLLGQGATGVSGVSSGDGAMDPPAVLQAYGNGRVPAELLTPIGIGRHRLWGPAAEAFVAMRAAAAKDGVRLSVTDSYRSYDQQVQLAAEKGLTINGGWAAVPGTSEHGWGLAVDVDVDSGGLAWLKANGDRFGWVQRTAREPWHWEFSGRTA